MIKYTPSELCLIWLDSLTGFSYKAKQGLYNLLDGKTELKKFIELNRVSLTADVGDKNYNTLLQSANKSYFAGVLDLLNERNIVAVTIRSKNYPKALVNTANPPLVLYAKGNLELLNEKAFAIVGSRKSLPISISTAETYAKSLSNAGFTLVTGIAEGVDKTVLETALENSGKVISVTAGGFDNIYPASHIELFNQVAKEGLVLSEYPPQVKAMPYNFPVRNRIIAGLSKGVLIVSGAIKSGTLHTAEYAEEFGRDLFAIPYGVGVPSGAGCNDLIKRGAYLTDTPKDILDFYGIGEVEGQDSSKKVALNLTDDEKSIVSALSNGSMHIDKLCEVTGKKIFEIMPIIAVLEIKAIVVKAGVNVYGLTRNDLEE